MRDKVFVRHILERCIKINRVISSTTQEEFLRDADKQDLVVHSLEIIGEATAHISDGFKKEHKNIPWREMKDLRNLLIHQYFRIDPEEIWTIAVTDIPELTKDLEKIE